ncbi:Cytochrome c oxidase assembly factor 1 homolog [Geodia barretti]|uniref:Cytochrome c oxidase assembly factor 1 homolog n=1 Tax=Geodia barretti TaxID=519541 RepID=A0AA35U1H5_GEOBA|nr:Cytochrome c oxidase assembly factor 1 homolog [Geodia barretti]
MLQRVSLESLKKAALYGAVLSATGCSVLYYLIQRNFARSPYYQQSIVALRQHQVACRLLGEPLRFQTLRLGNQQNWVTTEEAHVMIPVSGRRSAGQLRSTAVFRDGQWHLTDLVLEFRGRTEKLVIIDKSR